MAKKKSSLELPEDSLASIDEFGDRIYIHPAPVHGVFRKYKDIVHFLLMLLFLALPWIKIGGHQAVLLDLPQRKFALFGLTFWAHDAPMIFFVLATLTLTLSFVTALWGRVWCGWTCPQTVFIESVYRRIESWIEGNHIQRRRLDQAPLNWNKLWRRTLKWLLFLLVSLIITHSFLAYFVGTDRLLEMIQRPPSENWTNFLIILVTTFLILADLGWFREQFCIIACPYGRFQSVLMDDHSMAVLYDEKRGEPRKGQVPEGGQQGDCVNCYKCVAVCPTGVDIRRGIQLECIACTACIDACDEVMEKINKPKGLIRYSTERKIKGHLSRFWRPRVFVYLALITAVVSGLIVSVGRRQDLHVALIRSKDVPFKEITVEGGQKQLLNHYNMHIKNQSFSPLKVQMSLPQIWKDKGVRLVTPLNPLSMEPGKMSRSHIFIYFPPELTQGTGQLTLPLNFTSQLREKPISIEKSVSLLGPKE